MPAHEPVLAYYTRTLAQSASPCAQVGWESLTIQRLRFHTLLNAIDLSASNLRVLDVGCGLGDLYPYLLELAPQAHYRGIDLHPTMIAAAQRRHPQGHFAVADILDWPTEERFDLVIASGTLSLRFATEDTSLAIIERLFELATQAATFNLQTPAALERATGTSLHCGFWHVDPAALLPRLREITPWIVLREDVLRSDAFLTLYHPGTQPWATKAFSPLERAEICLHRGEHLQALHWLEQDPDAAPQARHALLRGVALCHLGGADADALAALTDAFQRAQSHPETDPLSTIEAAETLLHFYLYADDLTAARALVEQLDQRSQLGPEAPERLLLPLHEALLHDDRAEEAQTLEELLDDPGSTWHMRGARALALGHLDAAEEALHNALEHHPWNGAIRALLATAALRRGAPERALPAAMAVLDHHPRHDLCRHVALSALRDLAKAAARGDRQAAALIADAAHHPVLGSLARRLHPQPNPQT